MLMMLHADGPSRCWIDSWPLHHVNVKPESARKQLYPPILRYRNQSSVLVAISIQEMILGLRWPLS
jgi:hypothetical protein